MYSDCKSFFAYPALDPALAFEDKYRIRLRRIPFLGARLFIFNGEPIWGRYRISVLEERLTKQGSHRTR